MKIIHTLALTTLATAMAAGTAFAQQPPATPTPMEPQPMQSQPQQGLPPGMEGRDHGKDKPSYDELDTRGEGRLTRADLAGHPRMLEKFSDIDGDGDGTISRDEYDAWKSKKKDRDGGSQY